MKDQCPWIKVIGSEQRTKISAEKSGVKKKGVESIGLSKKIEEQQKDFKSFRLSKLSHNNWVLVTRQSSAKNTTYPNPNRNKAVQNRKNR